MSGPVLAVEGLSVEFRTPAGRLAALRDVSFAIGPGEALGVVGESGCGKSTLAAAILGLLAANGRVTAGRILFEGRDLVGLAEPELRRLRGERLSVVFQDPMTALNPVISIGRQMTDIQYRSGLSPKARRARAAAMLARVRIPDPETRLAQYPHEFSGGMRQRIAIAMALLAEPALLIADEPTTALDATLEVQVIELLKELRRDFGCAVMVVSHHLGVVAELCDRVVVMYAGEAVERGPVRDLFHRPAHPYARRLLECDPARLHERARRLPVIAGEVPSLLDPPDACPFEPRCDRRFARCAAANPPEVAVGAGHAVRCWLHGDPG
jgi:oligopeptide/dipeptide ABC transporter ATP-binding protein